MVPISYSYRNLLVRWRTNVMTAAAFTLVVTALVVMLAFVNGVTAVCVVSGRPDNVIVLKEGNKDEILSQIDKQTAARVQLAQGIRRGASGAPMASPELFSVITHEDASTKEKKLLQVRGVYEAAFDVHDRVRIIRGRRHRANELELILGRSAAGELGLRLGDTLELRGSEWRVVGVFEAGGALFETEIWCDLDQLAMQFNRQGLYSSIVLRADNPIAAQQVVRRLESDRSLGVTPKIESDYYAEQTEQMMVIRTGAYVIAIFMAIGAVAAVANTMFAAIGERIKDIAVMRLLGYRQRDIMLSFLLESMLIASIGGAVGCALGYAANGATLNTALADKSITFAFVVDPPTLLLGAAFSLAMGLFGGLLPAYSAMRVDPLTAMR